MDFANLELGENLAVDSQSDVFNAEFAELEKKMRILCKTHNKSIIQGTMVSRDSINPISSEQYNTRLYTVMHIIRNPALSDRRYPLKDTWTELYPHVPYPEKMTSTPWSKNHRDKLKDLMKDIGMYKYVEFSKTRHYIERANAYYKEQVIETLKHEVEELRQINLTMLTSGDIKYNNTVFKRSSRRYSATVNGKVVETRHGTFDKLTEFLSEIDKRSNHE